MKKVLALGLVALGAVASAQTPVRIGIAFDSGGKFDRSFNQSAWEGSQRAVKDLKVTVNDFQPTDPSQTIQGIRSFAQNGFDLTVGVGFANEPSITAVAKENPNLAFGLVDSESSAPNVASLLFQEEQGSYLVGYLAGLNTSTNVVGFIGGMDIPLIHKFQAGFQAGARAANKNIRVIAQYVGTTPEAWNNPARAKEIAASMKSRGADIVFAAAGASGTGLIDYIKQTQCIKASDLPRGTTFRNNNFANVRKAATYTRACAGNTRPMFFIGVDSNQNYLGDFDSNAATLNHGLTSMLKRVDNAVYALIRDVSRNQFKGGARRFGLAQNGVGYALDQYNRALVSAAQEKRLEEVRQAIIAGRIKVPTNR